MNHLKIFFTGLSYDWNEFKPVGRRPNCPCSTCRFTTWVYSGFHGRFHWNILLCSKFLLLQQVLAQLSLSLVIIDTFVPKLSLSTRSKKNPPALPFWNVRSTASGFNTQSKVESLKWLCNQRKNSRMITLKNCARCLEYFQVEKRCKQFLL